MNDEENKSKALRDSIDRMADELAKGRAGEGHQNGAKRV